MKTNTFKIGDKVRLRGAFLRSTGQFTGADTRRVWAVIAVDEMFVGVDEKRDWRESFSEEEFAGMNEQDRLIVSHRRFHFGNLIAAGAADHS